MTASAARGGSRSRRRPRRFGFLLRALAAPRPRRGGAPRRRRGRAASHTSGAGRQVEQRGGQRGANDAQHAAAARRRWRGCRPPRRACSPCRGGPPRGRGGRRRAARARPARAASRPSARWGGAAAPPRTRSARRRGGGAAPRAANGQAERRRRRCPLRARRTGAAASRRGSRSTTRAASALPRARPPMNAASTVETAPTVLPSTRPSWRVHRSWYTRAATPERSAAAASATRVMPVSLRGRAFIALAADRLGRPLQPRGLCLRAERWSERTLRLASERARLSCSRATRAPSLAQLQVGGEPALRRAGLPRARRAPRSRARRRARSCRSGSAAASASTSSKVASRPTPASQSCSSRMPGRVHHQRARRQHEHLPVRGGVPAAAVARRAPRAWAAAPSRTGG